MRARASKPMVLATSSLQTWAKEWETICSDRCEEVATGYPNEVGLQNDTVFKISSSLF